MWIHDIGTKIGLYKPYAFCNRFVIVGITNRNTYITLLLVSTMQEQPTQTNIPRRYIADKEAQEHKTILGSSRIPYRIFSTRHVVYFPPQGEDTKSIERTLRKMDEDLFPSNDPGFLVFPNRYSLEVDAANRAHEGEIEDTLITLRGILEGDRQHPYNRNDIREIAAMYNITSGEYETTASDSTKWFGTLEVKTPFKGNLKGSLKAHNFVADIVWNLIPEYQGPLTYFASAVASPILIPSVAVEALTPAEKFVDYELAAQPTQAEGPAIELDDFER